MRFRDYYFFFRDNHKIIDAGKTLQNLTDHQDQTVTQKFKPKKVKINK